MHESFEGLRSHGYKLGALIGRKLVKPVLEAEPLVKR
jgi:hypothetical protein